MIQKKSKNITDIAGTIHDDDGYIPHLTNAMTRKADYKQTRQM